MVAAAFIQEDTLLLKAVFLQLLFKQLSRPNQKINLHYTRGITPKRTTSDGAHLGSLAPGQHHREDTSQRWRAIGVTASDSARSGIEPRPSCADSDGFSHY